MKLLIGGKNRNIYIRKDGSAYYKSSGENVDVTYMFKKNGGGLKKQYIGGVKDNLIKVEKNKRSNKCSKQILGGSITSIIPFDSIEIKSDNIYDKQGNYLQEKASEQLKKICCLALYGLGAAMTGELKVEPADNNEVKVSLGTDIDSFVKYLTLVSDGDTKNYMELINNIIIGDNTKLINKILEASERDKKNKATDDKTFNEVLQVSKTGVSERDRATTVSADEAKNDVLSVFKTDVSQITDSNKKDVKIKAFRLFTHNEHFKETIEKLGINKISDHINFKDNFVTVTRPYILNKILQCFKSEGSNYIANKKNYVLSDDNKLLLAGKPAIIDVITGTINSDIDIDIIELFTNIYTTATLNDPKSIEISIHNLYYVLFYQEKIGAPLLALTDAEKQKQKIGLDQLRPFNPELLTAEKEKELAAKKVRDAQIIITNLQNELITEGEKVKTSMRSHNEALMKLKKEQELVAEKEKEISALKARKRLTPLPAVKL